jgi:hypothetical protein
MLERVAYEVDDAVEKQLDAFVEKRAQETPPHGLQVERRIIQGGGDDTY